jgi:hypothetical protein
LGNDAVNRPMEAWICRSEAVSPSTGPDIRRAASITSSETARFPSSVSLGRW